MENIQLTEKGNPRVIFSNMDKDREDFFLKYGSTPVNKILGYRILPTLGVLTLDLAPAKDLSLKEKKELIRDGFRKIAIRTERDRWIREIIAVSPIVNDHPKLLEEKGFTIVDSLPDKILRTALKVLSNKHKVEGETKQTSRVGLAVITREDFLRIYLK